MKLVLFDVDGTLISTKGAGMRAFYRALKHHFGVEVGNGAIRPDGMTDPLILKGLLNYCNLAERWCDETREELFSKYLTCLEEEMSQASRRGLIRVLPGVQELLSDLCRQKDFAVGLVTGNLEKGAFIKLSHAGLDGFFRFGGYGSDSENRTELTRLAIQRGTRLVAPKRVENSFVIGDTPLDVLHGRAAGVYVIAVASARYSMDDLASCDPDLLVSDLTAADIIISFMRQAPARAN
jgi:phosphoglycolate phosphatase-like HAD superfamily hydrolase